MDLDGKCVGMQLSIQNPLKNILLSIFVKKKKKLCFNKSDLVGNIQLIICKFTVILKNPYLGKKGTN